MGPIFAELNTKGEAIMMITMRRLLMCTVLTATVCAFFVPSAEAGVKIGDADKSNLEIAPYVQFFYDHREGRAPDGTSALDDFRLRRVRLFMSGQIGSPFITFMFQPGADGLGNQTAGPSATATATAEPASVGSDASSFRILDASVTLNFDEAFKLSVGQQYLPFSREFGSYANSRLMTLDYSFITQKTLPGNTNAFPLTEYDMGAVAWGNPANGIIHYRLGVSQGRSEPNPSSQLRYSGRLEVNFLDPVKEWYRYGTYLGKKKIFAIGGGFDMQNDAAGGGAFGPVRNYRAGTVDVFFDHPVGNGAVTFEAAYLSFNYNGATGAACATGGCTTQTVAAVNTAVNNSDGTGYYLQGGYLLPGIWGVGKLQGQLQPLARFQHWNSGFVNRDRTETDFGLNYFVVGHDFKIALDYAVIDDQTDRGTVENRFTVGVFWRL
jgi:hypothetical protein